jgi:hypothetical protein
MKTAGVRLNLSSAHAMGFRKLSIAPHAGCRKFPIVSWGPRLNAPVVFVGRSTFASLKRIHGKPPRAQRRWRTPRRFV